MNNNSFFSAPQLKRGPLGATTMAICSGAVVMVPVAAWIGVAVLSHRKAVLDHSRIGPLSWRAQMDMESFDDIGRRLIRRSVRMAWGFFPFAFLMILIGHLLCPSEF